MKQLLAELAERFDELAQEDDDFARILKTAEDYFELLGGIEVEEGVVIGVEPDTDVLIKAFDSWHQTDELLGLAVSEVNTNLNEFYEEVGTAYEKMDLDKEDQLNERLGKCITFAGAVAVAYALHHLVIKESAHLRREVA
jgi:hypothetical protein